MKCMLLSTLFLSFCPFIAFAQQPYYVESIFDVGSRRTHQPFEVFTYQGKYYWVHQDDQNGEELWQTDGTPAGTSIVFDLNPGRGDEDMKILGVAEGYLWLVAEVANQKGLYRTDGTAAGTSLVLNNFFDGYTLHEGWFAGANEEETFKLRLSDLNLEILPGNATPKQPFVVNGTLFYWGGSRLFREDGLNYFMYDIPNVSRFAAAQNNIYIFSSSGTLHYVPSDGGEPVLLVDTGSSFAFLQAFDDRVLVWRQVGLFTVPFIYGTTPESEVVIPYDFDPPQTINNLAQFFGDTFYLFLRGSDGRGQWTLSDGTAEGTVRLFDETAGPDIDRSYQPTVVANGSAYVIFDNALWRSNGTPETTAPVVPLQNASLVGAAGDNLLYLDRQAQMLKLISTVDFSTTDLVPSFYQDEDLLFSAATGGDRGVFAVEGSAGENKTIWSSDGTTSGTRLQGIIDADLITFSIGDQAFFIRFNEQTGNDDLWRLDDSENGAHRVNTVESPENIVTTDQFAYFFYDDRVHRYGPDGSGQLLFNIDFYSGPTAVHNGFIYFDESGAMKRFPDGGTALETAFGGDDGIFYFGGGPDLYVFENSNNLFRLEGGILADPAPGRLDIPYAFSTRANPVSFNGAAYLTVGASGRDYRLMKIEGDTVTDFFRIRSRSGGLVSPEMKPVIYKNHLYFPADDGIDGTELWRTDGTTVTLFKAFMPGSTGGFPQALTVVDDYLFFTARDTEGLELWRSDGTPEGTVPLPLTPGPAGSNVQNLVGGNKLLFFTASTTDRTALHALRTEPLADISGPASVCAAIQAQASVLDAGVGATYAWAITNGVIDAGQGTAAVSFTADGVGDVTLSCMITQSGISAQSQIVIALDGSPPAAAGLIDGIVDLCSGGETQRYRVDAVAGAVSYSWRVPADAVILSGQGTEEITVVFGNQDGEVAVTPVNACGMGTESVLPISVLPAPSQAYAGPDQTVCGTSIALGAIMPQIGVGSWSIISGSGGTLSDAGDPHSLFSGQTGLTYLLEWRVDSMACGFTSDQVEITFQQTANPVDAGPDQTLCGLSAQIHAVNPGQGTGFWSILQGAGGYFDNPYAAETTFYGLPGQDYTLAWSVYGNACGVAQDTVQISTPRSPVLDIAHVSGFAGASIVLPGAFGTAGQWRVMSGPDLAIGQFVDPNKGRALFIPSEPGDYVLRRTLEDGCGQGFQEVTVTAGAKATVTELPIPAEPCTQNENWNGEGVSFDGYFWFTTGGRLWRSDGTASGTAVVAPLDFALEYLVSENRLWILGLTGVLTINAGTHETSWLLGGHLDSRNMVVLDDIRYYLVQDQIYRSNGTAEGTFRMGDHLPLWGMNVSILFGAAGSNLIFKDPINQVFAADTRTGEIRLLFQDQSVSVFESKTQSFGDQLFFEWDNDLYVTNGRPEGTVLLTTGFRFGDTLARMGDYVYFNARYLDSWDLWRSDGTRAGTFMVRDLDYPNDGFVDNFKPAGDIMYYAGGNLLYVTDGTFSGTRSLGEQSGNNGVVGPDGYLYYLSGDRLYRTDAQSTSGQEITENGASLDERPITSVGRNIVLWDRIEDVSLKNLNHDTLAVTDVRSEPLRCNVSGIEIEASGEHVFIYGPDGFGVTSRDGYRELIPSGFPEFSDVQPYNDGLFFPFNGGIWYSDGTFSGTRFVVDEMDLQDPPLTLGGLVYFIKSDSDGQDNLWRSDGSPSGTVQAADVTPGESDGIHTNMVVYRGHIYFTATTDNQTRLFAYNPTGGNLDLIPLNTIQINNFTELFVVNDRLFFFAGTTLGTYHPVKGETILSRSNLFIFRATNAVVLGDKILWSTSSDIWFSDGTPSGTDRLILDNTTLRNPELLTRFGNKVFFLADTPGKVNQPYISDGTTAGTFELDEWALESLRPKAWRGKLYTSFQDGPLGWELHQFDGTTFTPMAEFIPGPNSAVPSVIRTSKDGLFTFEARYPPRIMQYTMDPWFEDPILQAAALADFDEDNNGQLSYDEVKDVTTWDISGLGVTSLEGIQVMASLEVLDAADNNIADVSSLLRNESLFSDQNHALFLSGNALTEDACEALVQMAGRAYSVNGQFDVSDQQEVLGIPPFFEWPRYTILELIGGGLIEPDPLVCPVKLPGGGL